MCGSNCTENKSRVQFSMDTEGNRQLCKRSALRERTWSQRCYYWEALRKALSETRRVGAAFRIEVSLSLRLRSAANELIVTPLGSDLFATVRVMKFNNPAEDKDLILFLNAGKVRPMSFTDGKPRFTAGLYASHVWS